MQEISKFHVGLDVHKDSISVAAAEPGRMAGRLVGKVVHDVSKLLKLLSKIGAPEHLMQGLGHADRHSGLTGYCTGLMLPFSRKSVEPIAARVDPLRTSAKHQSLHHFVAKAQWSDQELLRRVAQWVVPLMDFTAGGWWIIDDTGFPKKGKHSVGVTRQYCGVLGKQDNCQVAVSVTLACEEGSLPVAWQLYLPHVWAEDDVRRVKAGIPEDIKFATKPQIALQQIEDLLSEGAPRHCVLADAGYGISTLPETTAWNDLVHAAHMRWRIERDYQDLKQDLGLGHYEGRGWRGFHHHATLSIAAYGFLMAQRLQTGSDASSKKNFVQRQVPAIPDDYVPRGSPARAASRAKLDHNVAPSTRRRARNRSGALPALQLGESTSTFVTQ